MCSVLKSPPQILCTVGVSLCPPILAHIHHVYLSAPCLTSQPMGANACHVCQLLSFLNLLLVTILQNWAESVITHRSAASVCPGQGVMLSHMCFVNFSAYAISVQAPSGYVTNTSVVYPPLGVKKAILQAVASTTASRFPPHPFPFLEAVSCAILEFPSIWSDLTCYI